MPESIYSVFLRPTLPPTDSDMIPDGISQNEKAAQNGGYLIDISIEFWLRGQAMAESDIR